MRPGLLLAAALGVTPLSVVAAGCFDASGSPSPLPGYDASHFGDVGPDSLVLDSPVFADGTSDDATTDADSGADAASVDSAMPVDAGADADADAAPPLTYPQVVRADTPLSYWRLGEASSSVATDEIGFANGTYNGTVTHGAPGAIAGDTNTAATFDGATGYVLLGGGFAFLGTASMSIEAWIKPGTLDNGYRRFLSRETADGNGRQGYLMAAVAAGGMGNLSFERFRDGASQSIGANIPIAQYSHIVATYDGTTMKMYVNGAMVDSVASAASLSNIGVTLNLATYSNAALGPAEYFPGTIDEVAIYDHAITAARVLAHYQKGIGM